ncbi:hypothetical protein B0I72DRAFT_135570 [Yarrowia lipolytica]|jgi:hypothetical protein|uniref:Uncharacterized protein n=1 Tax=Yarrowia lipolytica TaxID=4952 RepID=A0A371CFD1_YARLL|nr:hypothetical protein BKA91DRAFT_136655 [Yarrowia lipolytica]KAE8173375.1 hypothetical protein BKA90DRAFT_135978 [Yarrowia lipolytica]RDW28994.1 hypothetical protein B0I71DRAFT_126667 [Yarrowia lipolytica]RDW33881.1 hypothetical protein B0I72DRAFT_135570 [Yarrowia lipolytica]RDW40020.1 hypothetical protein B0I73DRAFT_131101 [Yarrowia lipolytica]
MTPQKQPQIPAVMYSWRTIIIAWIVWDSQTVQAAEAYLSPDTFKMSDAGIAKTGLLEKSMTSEREQLEALHVLFKHLSLLLFYSFTSPIIVHYI